MAFCVCCVVLLLQKIFASSQRACLRAAWAPSLVCAATNSRSLKAQTESESFLTLTSRSPRSKNYARRRVLPHSGARRPSVDDDCRRWACWPGHSYHARAERVQKYQGPRSPPPPAAAGDASVWSDTAKHYLVGLGGRGQVALKEIGAWEGVVEPFCSTVVAAKIGTLGHQWMRAWSAYSRTGLIRRASSHATAWSRACTSTSRRRTRRSSFQHGVEVSSIKWVENRSRSSLC